MVETALNSYYPPGASPEEIWAILREVAESQKETDRKFQEVAELQKEVTGLHHEVAELQKETKLQIQETSRQMKETDKKIGELSNRFGELAEHLVAPSIREKFNSLGFTFEEVSPNKQINDAAGNHVAEIDLLLENSETVMVVEINAKPNDKDVKEHIKRMEVLRRRADARQDKRALLGAIAGAIMGKEMRSRILKNGFYVIEQTGDTVMINIPEGFRPRMW